MGAIEIYFGTITLIIMLIALARGYHKELGSTMIIMVAIFLLRLVEEQFNPALTRLGAAFFPVSETPNEQQLFLSSVYLLFFVVAVFAGYAGQTITFAGKPLPPPRGTILTLVVGFINGYLIAGTVWYYQDAYGYPLSQFGLLKPEFSPVAQALIQVLPQNLMPSSSLWMIPIAVLLLIRVRG
ncbi:MAG: hypothetical protein D6790_14840 [Caldilineae bacterium]|nr:MAG: hypothetical protein D6790_14840 [Caldilineae bacterium]